MLKLRHCRLSHILCKSLLAYILNIRFCVIRVLAAALKKP
jgi:hypothetical protein